MGFTQPRTQWSGLYPATKQCLVVYSYRRLVLVVTNSHRWHAVPSAPWSARRMWSGWGFQFWWTCAPDHQSLHRIGWYLPWSRQHRCCGRSSTALPRWEVRWWKPWSPQSLKSQAGVPAAIYPYIWCLAAHAWFCKPWNLHAAVVSSSRHRQALAAGHVLPASLIQWHAHIIRLSGNERIFCVGCCLHNAWCGRTDNLPSSRPNSCAETQGIAIDANQNCVETSSSATRCSIEAVTMILSGRKVLLVAITCRAAAQFQMCHRNRNMLQWASCIRQRSESQSTHLHWQYWSLQHSLQQLMLSHLWGSLEAAGPHCDQSCKQAELAEGSTSCYSIQLESLHNKPGH